MGSKIKDSNAATTNCWSKKSLESFKFEIKKGLDDATQGGDPNQRLELALKGVEETWKNDADDAKPRCFIFIVSALLAHAKVRGLSSTQTRTLADRAFDILRAHAIMPTTHRLGQLYGDVHMALAQIYLRDGATFDAAWEQLSAQRTFSDKDSLESSFQLLGLAKSMMQMGNTELALSCLEQIESSKTNDHLIQYARLNRIRLLRLANDLDESAALSLATDTNRWTPPFVSELHWEKICRNAIETRSLNEMSVATKHGGSHYEPIYILEAILWCSAHANPRWEDSHPKIDYLKRVFKGLGDIPFLPKYIETLEMMRDHSLPFHIRLNAFGTILRKRHQINSIQQLMLVYASMSRVVFRSQNYSLAAIALHEYRALCLRLSYGHCVDTLKIATDLFQKDWFQKGLRNKTRITQAAS